MKWMCPWPGGAPANRRQMHPGESHTDGESRVVKRAGEGKEHIPMKAIGHEGQVRSGVVREDSARR